MQIEIQKNTAGQTAFVINVYALGQDSALRLKGKRKVDDVLQLSKYLIQIITQ